jgi:hypothetical protein
MKITRAEFLKRIRNLLEHFEEDHEAHTGIGPDERMTFSAWADEINNAHDNTVNENA